METRLGPGGIPRRAGFTLLELIAVIGIIALMGTIVVGGFSAIQRALSKKTGEDDLRRSLNLARQQACVDGQPIHLWVTGIDRYAVARKAGVVTSKSVGGKQDFEWGSGSVTNKFSLQPEGVWWLRDEYADLTPFRLPIEFDSLWTEDDVKNVVLGYKGLLVFDMTNGAVSSVIVPPMYNKDAESWVFGIRGTGLPSGAFAAGHPYGWLVYPEQSLPKGYVFDGSWDDDGNFKDGFQLRVCFLPTGAANAKTVFPIHELATKAVRNVTVEKTGKIH
jgi:prepilin-type N-terminal cleavage/methylation domain-containing protein